MTQGHTASDSREWKRARQAAFVQDALATIMQRPSHLTSFDQVSRKLELGNVRYLGVQVVIEDYVHGPGMKVLSLLLSRFAHVLFAVAGIFAILKIGLGA